MAFEPENVEDLCEKILTLYNNPVLASSLGENGLRYVSENFNRDEIAREFYDKLRQIQ